MPRAAAESSSAKPAGKPRAGGKRKKLTAFNKFIQSEMARLKEEEPDMQHKDRFKLATSNWKTAKENPRAI